MIKIIVLMGILSSLVGCHPKIEPNDTIVSFSFSKGGGMRRFDGYRYFVKRTEEGQAYFLFNEEYPDELEFTIDDGSVFDSLQQIVLKHKIYKYDGHYNPPMRVHDGHSWNLYIKYTSGKTISASGYMAGPSGYRDAFDELRACLDPWKETPVEKNGLASFDYTYLTTLCHIEPQGDHALVTIDDESTGRHEVIEKPLEMLEDLRVTAITERLKENGTLRSDDPNSKPFKFDVVFANGNHYVYESYDLDYKCHKTEVMYWFFERWDIEFNFSK